jgi:hypothetical protein
MQQSLHLFSTLLLAPDLHPKTWTSTYRPLLLLDTSGKKAINCEAVHDVRFSVFLSLYLSISLLPKHFEAGDNIFGHQYAKFIQLIIEFMLDI